MKLLQVRFELCAVLIIFTESHHSYAALVPGNKMDVAPAPTQNLRDPKIENVQNLKSVFNEVSFTFIIRKTIVKMIKSY
jgi:hypothetical protein